VVEKCKIQLYFGLIILEDHYKNLVNDKCPIAMKKLNSLNHLSAKMKRTYSPIFGTLEILISELLCSNFRTQSDTLQHTQFFQIRATQEVND